MKAIGYIRVSTQEQAVEGISLENQKERIKNYCSYKNLELLEILEDAGISGGKNKSRSGFITLLDTIENNGIDVLVLYSVERLSRDMLTLLAFERLSNECDIELHTIEGQIDTSTPDGFMNFAMKAFIGEMERRQIKYRTKKAMEYKKQQNNVVGSIPYGYTRIDDNLIENEEERKVIKLVNNLYQTTKNLSAICRELTEKNIFTRTGKKFDAGQIKRLLKNYNIKFTQKSNKITNTIRDFITGIA